MKRRRFTLSEKGNRNIRIALRPLIRLHAVRDAMIEAGCVRTSINRQIGRIKRMFRWALENEYVPAEVYSALGTVAGLPCTWRELGK